MTTRSAFITGITGQDGAFLAQLLLENGYTVHGGMRTTSSPNSWRLKELGIIKHIEFHEMDLFEQNNINAILKKIKPDELYNLAAQSFVGSSFDQPVYTGEINALGVIRILEAIRHYSPETRFYQASTSEMYGKVEESPQSETTRFHPRSPYALAKVYGHWATVNYRESYGIHASSGILFNHESPLRGPNFVTRKITWQLAEIAAGVRDVLWLGNVDAKRDWGYAKEYIDGMHRMLQQDTGDDYVLATGRTNSVRRFVEKVAQWHDIDIEWRGIGLNEVGVNSTTGAIIVRVNPKFFRPAEVDVVTGNPGKALRELGWRAETRFEELAHIMAEADAQRVKASLA